MPRKQRNPSYQIKGAFYEFCDCLTVCPCWVGLPPNEQRCTGAFGWKIASGHINGVDVTDRSVVSVSYHSGHRDTGGQEVYIFVDARASDAQFDVLVAAFSGRTGGRLAELQQLMGVLREARRASIDLTTKGRYSSITVDDSIKADGEVILGSDDKITTLSHGRLTGVLGTTAEVGTSTRFRIDLGLGSIGIDVRERAAMRGSFSYRFGGAAS